VDAWCSITIEISAATGKPACFVGSQTEGQSQPVVRNVTNLIPSIEDVGDAIARNAADLELHASLDSGTGRVVFTAEALPHPGDEALPAGGSAGISSSSEGSRGTASPFDFAVPLGASPDGYGVGPCLGSLAPGHFQTLIRSFQIDGTKAKLPASASPVGSGVT